MNPKRKAFLEQQRQREEQMKRRAAEQAAAAHAPDMPRPPRRVEVIGKPVHDGCGGKFESGAVVTETADNQRAIELWLARGWARLTT